MWALVGGFAACSLVAGCGASTTASAGDEADVTAAKADNTPPLPANYDTLSAKAKEDLLWDQRIVPSKYTTLPPFKGPDLIAIARVDLRVTLDRRSDEMPPGRIKLVHPLGALAKVEFVPEPGSPYTGLWKGSEGIARFSLATSPGTNNFTPGLAVKMFIDGKPSSNLQFMFSIDGQGKDFDFFSNQFTNLIEKPRGIGTNLIGAIFKKATPFPNFLDLVDFGRFDRSGKLEDHQKSPRVVQWVPTFGVRKIARSNTPTVDFRTDLAKVPSGTILYDAIAIDKSGAPIGKVGHLVTRSEIIAASYGDQKLFFKHEEATVDPDK